MNRAAKGVIILGSARNDGDAAQLAAALSELAGCPVVDLGDYEIEFYDYAHGYSAQDDFRALMKMLIGGYGHWLMATPVYWYAMSAPMKAFFDRFTDLLTIEKGLGRQLRGKALSVATVSNGSHLGDAFWLPFSSTASYLGMSFKGGLHTGPGTVSPVILSHFLQQTGFPMQ